MPLVSNRPQCLPSRFAGSCTSTWTRSTRPSSSGTTRRCAGMPVAVGGSPERRGVVAAASYEARAFGVRSAIPMARAVRLCPSLVIVRPDFATVQRGLADRLRDLPLGDAARRAAVAGRGVPRCHGERLGRSLGQSVAQRLKAEIRNATGLTASAGVAPNKFLAKIASAGRNPTA